MKVSTPQKIKSIVLLVVIVIQTVYPTTALALADSPNQPEFEAYEDFGSTDMVNLATGDFTYNIPLLNVPSPEGGFQVPLSYHAGIELNEESSWVGLGWGLNPGALTRNVSMYPDDFSGENVGTVVSNPGGNGYVKSYPFYTKYFDSKKGNGGSVDIMGIIDFGWKSQKHFGFTPSGLELRDGKISYDANRMAYGLVSAAALAAPVFGNAAIVYASTALSAGYAGYSAYAAQQAKSNTAGSTNVGAWTLEQNVAFKGDVFGIWGKKSVYKYYLSQSEIISQYGALYLGNMKYTYLPTQHYATGNSYIFNNTYNASDLSTTGITGNSARTFSSSTGPGNPSSDMFITYYNGNYDQNYSPTSLTYDNYSVKGAGVSGNISPYRLEIGSLCNKVPVGTDFMANVGPQYLPSTSYKVPFKYQGDFSNSYNYQGDGSNIFDISLNSNFYVWNKNSKTYVDYPQSTYAVGAVPYNTNYSAANITEANRTGLYNKKLAHAKHIDWYANSEIISGAAQSEGFMDTHQGYERTGLPTGGIGGFCVTNEAGYTYHYAQPVYNNKDFTLVLDTATGPYTKYVTTDSNMYAHTWLLTGITGPDFVDRGTTGIIDDQDWGYYVKFDYGRFASDYLWRSPYHGYNNEGKVRTCKRGSKETYYLNRISTRTHSALFVKSYKQDGKGYYESNGSDEFGLWVKKKPSSSLKLDDIYVLENSDYNKLITATSSGGEGLVLENTEGENETVQNGDTYSFVLDNYDIAASPGIQTFLDTKQLEKIHFNYTQDLCRYTYNSFDFDGSGNGPNKDGNIAPSDQATRLKGKLTLKSVEFFGKNNFNLLPSYIFYYGPNEATTNADNPDYHPYKFDGYGMYKSGGNGREDTPHNAEKKCDQWCLTKIITPLGGEIHIEYERDMYANLNGYTVNHSSIKLIPAFTSTSGITMSMHSDNVGSTTNLSDLLSTPCAATVLFSSGIPMFTQINSISGNDLTFAGVITNTNLPLEVDIKTNKKYGGGIRVKSITTKDENNNEYVTNYFYTKDGTANGVSSGVASFEPESERGLDGNFAFYNRYEHPFSPIMYSNVTVVNGRNDNTFKENSKQVFHFVTPHSDMITSMQPQNIPFIGTNINGLYSNCKTIDGTACIGNLDTVKVYNQFNNLVSKTVFDYTDNANGQYANKLGGYSELTVLWETIRISSAIYPRIVQSYKFKKPNILRSVTSYKDRLVSKQAFLSYDYITGQALTTRSTFGDHETYESEIVPAHLKYAALSSKAYASSNKNIMMAPAETRSYVYDKNNQKKLLGASVMTWNNTNSYREYNSGTGLYQNQTYTDVWFPYQTYNWKSKVEENGTVNNSDYVAFNWAGSPDARWIKTEQANIYDHYSHTLQSQDINGNASSVKYGYNNSYPVGSCEKTLYTAWCFSGAEDKSSVTDYYEGEVKGSTKQFNSTTYAHTGNYCSKMSPGQSGFTFRVPKADLPATGFYRASVWVHQNGVQGAYLDCKGYNSSNGYVHAGGASFFGVGYTNNGGSTIEKAGSWYLLSIDVDLSAIPGTVSYLVFNVENNGINAYTPFVYADDFRVHPLSAPITTNVFEPKTGKLIATLDKENFAVKYAYDDAGKLKAVYKESKLGFTQVSKTNYNYAR